MCSAQGCFFCNISQTCSDQLRLLETSHKCVIAVWGVLFVQPMTFLVLKPFKTQEDLVVVPYCSWIWFGRCVFTAVESRIISFRTASHCKPQNVAVWSTLLYKAYETNTNSLNMVRVRPVTWVAWASLCCFCVTMSVLLKLPQLKSISCNCTVRTHVPCQLIHTRTHTPAHTRFVMVYAFPSPLYWMLSELLLFVFLWEITSQNNGPARLCVGVRFCVHTDMCLSTSVLSIKLETCSMHAWICTLCFCTLDLLFVAQSSHARTFRTAELFALRPLTMANIVVEMLLTQVPWEVKDWFLKIPGLWRFC